jgi:hypothetical protein
MRRVDVTRYGTAAPVDRELTLWRKRLRHAETQLRKTVGAKRSAYLGQRTICDRAIADLEVRKTELIATKLTEGTPMKRSHLLETERAIANAAPYEGMTPIAADCILEGMLRSSHKAIGVTA